MADHNRSRPLDIPATSLFQTPTTNADPSGASTSANPATSASTDALTIGPAGHSDLPQDPSIRDILAYLVRQQDERLHSILATYQQSTLDQLRLHIQPRTLANSHPLPSLPHPYVSWPLNPTAYPTELGLHTVPHGHPVPFGIPFFSPTVIPQSLRHTLHTVLPSLPSP